MFVVVVGCFVLCGGFEAWVGLCWVFLSVVVVLFGLLGFLLCFLLVVVFAEPLEVVEVVCAAFVSGCFVVEF